MIQDLGIGAKAEGPNGRDYPKDETVSVQHVGQGMGADRAADARTGGRGPSAVG